MAGPMYMRPRTKQSKAFSKGIKQINHVENEIQIEFELKWRKRTHVRSEVELRSQVETNVGQHAGNRLWRWWPSKMEIDGIKTLFSSRSL